MLALTLTLTLTLTLALTLALARRTNWGTEMPAPLRGVIRLLQHLGRDKYECGEYMFTPLCVTTPRVTTPRKLI